MSLQRLTILVVDDDAINRRSVRTLLESKGFLVLEASDGVDGFHILENDEVDAVVSDVLMPNMDGFLFCEKVRLDKKLRNLPFILYSAAYNAEADRAFAISLGADGYVIKPSPAQDLLDAIAAAMEDPAAGTAKVELHATKTAVLKKYNAALVEKLEDKNGALQATLSKLESANARILDLNRELEKRVAQRTLELEESNQALAKALAEVKELSGFIPICGYCKKVRDDENFWNSVEVYVSRRTKAQFSHGICPECYVALRAELNLPEDGK